MLSYFHHFIVFVWTGENDSKTPRVDAFFLFLDHEEKQSPFSKISEYEWTGPHTNISISQSINQSINQALLTVSLHSTIKINALPVSRLHNKIFRENYINAKIHLYIKKIYPIINYTKINQP